MPQWVSNMGAAIKSKTGSDNNAYEVTVSYNNGQFMVDVDSNLDTSSTGGATIYINWSGVSNDPHRYFTGEIADAVYDNLFGSSAFLKYNGKYLTEIPIHLIGHSRGASLNAHLAYRFAEDGIVVHQVTNLDPHPVIGDFKNS